MSRRLSENGYGAKSTFSPIRWLLVSSLGAWGLVAGGLVPGLLLLLPLLLLFLLLLLLLLLLLNDLLPGSDSKNDLEIFYTYSRNNLEDMI